MQGTRETWVWSLGGEDPLEEGMATHSSNLAWRISWTEEPGRLQSMGSHKSQTWLKRLSTHTHTHTEIRCFLGHWIMAQAGAYSSRVQMEPGVLRDSPHLMESGILQVHPLPDSIPYRTCEYEDIPLLGLYSLLGLSRYTRQWLW